MTFHKATYWRLEPAQLMASIAAIVSSPRDTGVRCAIALGSLAVLGVNAQPVATDACPYVSMIRFNRSAPWSCKIALEADTPYLVRVSQDDADVTVAWLDAAGQVLTRVDSPARRSGPELMMAVPHESATYSFVVRSTDSGSPEVDAEFTLVNQSNPADSRILEGLTLLTQAAAVHVDEDQPDSLDIQARELETAADLFLSAGRRDLQAESRLRLAALHYWIANDWTRAAAEAAIAGEIFATINDPLGLARADTLRGAALIETSDASTRVHRRGRTKDRESPFEEGKRRLTSAIDTFSRRDMKSAEAEAQNYLGVAHFYESRPAEARQEWTLAVRLYDDVSESPALPLQNLAVLDYGEGNYGPAIAAYERVMALFDAQTSISTRVAVLNNLSVAERVTGRVDKALALQLSALRIAESPVDRAQTLHNLGVIYLSLGDGQRATTFLEQALLLRRPPETGDRRGLLTSLLRTGEIYRERGEYSQALELHAEALVRADSLTERGRSLLAVAEDRVATGHFDAARQAARAAQELNLPSQWPLARSIASTVAYVRLRAGDTGGESALLAAAEANVTAGDAEVAARDFHRLALEAYRAEALDPALQYTKRAIGIYETQRLFAVNPDLRATYLALRAETYYLRTEILMMLAERSAEVAERDRWIELALSTADAARDRALTEFASISDFSRNDESTEASDIHQLDRQIAAKRHRLADVQDQRNPSTEQIRDLQQEIQLLRTRADFKLRKSTTSALKSPQLSLAELQAKLPQDTLALTYLSGYEHTWLVALSPDAIFMNLLGPRLEIERDARELAARWSSYAPGLDPEFELSASDRLLGSASLMLEGRSRLLVVVDGDLRRLPFSALRVRRRGEYDAQRLGATHAVSYRATLAALSAVDAVEPSGEAKRMLLVGAPRFGRALADESSDLVVGALVPLPGAGREIDAVESIAVGWEVDRLTGERATKANFLHHPINSYRILHFATHAQLDVQDPQLSAIALTSVVAGKPVKDPMLSLREVVGLDLNADAVVLSTCDSSVGKSYRAQTSFGLSEAFLMAGARQVLGSLWQVPDQATREYMERLYAAYMEQGEDLAEASFVAMRSMMRNPRYRNPYYWAAFVVLMR